MNNIYLKKLIEQETSNVKLQLVQEHLQLAKKEFSQKQKDLNKTNNLNVLSEQPIYMATPGKAKWNPPYDQAEKFLKKLKGKVPVKNTFLVPAGEYEVILTINPQVGDKKTSPYKNKFRFNNNGVVYDYNQGTEFGYEYKNNKINILSKDPTAKVSFASNDIILATIDSSGKFTKNTDTETSSDDPLANYSSVLDPLQTVLDWLGFIPIYGDAVDAINSLLYFYRGKYFEGILSAIAIIPIVGSGIKFGVKAGYKAGAKGLSKLGFTKLIQKWWLTGSGEAVQKMTRDMIKKGDVSVNDLSAISNVFSGFGTSIGSAKSGWVSAFGPGSVSKSLDYAIKRVKQFAKNVDEVLIGAKKVDKVKDVVKPAKKFLATPRKILNTLTLNVIPRLKKLPFYPAKKLTAMAAQTKARFLRTTVKRPDRLGFLAKSTPSAERDVIATMMNKQYKGLLQSQQTIIDDIILKSGKSISTSWSSILDSAAETTEFFAKLTKKSPEVAENLAETLINQSMKNDNVFWTLYKTDAGNRLISGAFGKDIQLQLSKNVDVIYDELVQADIGIFDSPEHLRTVGIAPLTKVLLQQAMPGSYKKGGEIMNFIGNKIGTARTFISGIAQDAFDIQLDNITEYPALQIDDLTYEENKD